MSAKNGRPLHVVICTPTRGEMQSGFTFDLALLVGYTGNVFLPQGASLGLQFAAGTYIDENRCDIVQQVLTNPSVTHLLFLDDDMRFPKDLVIRLLKHQRPIVACNYAHRSANPDVEPTAVKTNRERLVTLPSSHGLERAEGIGLGCVLIQRRVFDTVAYPWFESYYSQEGKRWVGEDFEFCARARAAGFTIDVDHDLSKLIRHIGKFEFTLEHTPQWEAATVSAPAPVALVK